METRALTRLSLEGSSHNWTAPHEVPVGVQDFRRKDASGAWVPAPYPWRMEGTSRVKGLVYERRLEWGRCRIRYGVKGNRLELTVTTTNDLEDDLSDVRHFLDYIDLPVAAGEIKWANPRIDKFSPPVFPVTAGDTVIFLQLSRHR